VNAQVVDENLCYICQEVPPTLKATKGRETFRLCRDCAVVLIAENNRQNAVKQSLGKSKIFTYTLGLDPTPVKIKLEKLED
jgi:hypothetical protein